LGVSFWCRPCRIIQLYGQEGTGYEVAVIYSCNEVLGITVNTVSMGCVVP
jgi:phage-related holin